MKKAAASILAVCGLVIAAAVPVSCSKSTDADFKANVRVHLSASDRYDPVKTVFQLQFSTAGKTIWPGRNTRLVLLVDGVERAMPGQWGSSVVTDHILPNRPRAAYWWMTGPELTAWLGAGDHELQIQFGSVKSNVLKVSVPAQGRATYEPELEVSSWTKGR